jgi:biopolymer transport protein ExbD
MIGMADKKRFLDVWLVEANIVYREVPFDVVASWIEQSRLLAGDRLKPSGTREWLIIGEHPTFSAYLPRPAAVQTQDVAEALEPVQLEFAWKKRGEDEDEDVDMIPLIDVSLVLLIFFMMTTTGIVIASTIRTPPAEAGYVLSDPDLVWIGIDLAEEKDPVTGKMRKTDRKVYSVGNEHHDARQRWRKDNLPDLKSAVEELKERLKTVQNPVPATIKADEDVDSGDVTDAVDELTKLSGVGGKIKSRLITVSEPK